MHFPLVTVGVPFFNDKKIFDCLESLFLQSYTNLQIVVSDNFSKDDLSEKLCSFSKEKNIEYFRNDKNYGAIYNHNKLLDYAKGEYFLWLHSDDKISKNFIKKSVEILERDNEVVSVVGNINVLDKINSNIVVRKYREPNNLNCERYQRIKNFIKGDFPDTFLNALHRKSKIKRLGNYFSNEIPFIYNLLNEGKIFGCGEIYYFKNEDQNKRNFKSLSTHYNPLKKLYRHSWFKECLIILFGLKISNLKKIFLIVSFFFHNSPILRTIIKKNFN